MADNRQNLLNEISDGLKGIRDAINNSSNVTIPEDTPLQDYKDYIEEISQTHVDIGKQIFVFYTGARTAEEAKGYDKPSIHGNTETDDGGTVQETNDGQLEIPDNSNVSGSEPTDTYYTFVMFVSLSIKKSTGSDFEGPTPVQISGSKGEQGEKGDPGKDGIVAGLVLNTNINLYSLTPNIAESNLAYDIEEYENSPSYALLDTFLKYNNKPIERGSNDSSDSLFLTCPETNAPVYTLTVKVSSNTPVVKIIYGPICQSISDVAIKYSNDGDEGTNEASVSKENPNLYAKVKIKFGAEERESRRVLIAKYPNEIENFNIIAYGTSGSTTEEPTLWQGTMPDMNEEGCPSVLWGKYRVEHLDSDKTTEINIPILHRGTAGIPYNLIMTFEEELDITDDSNNPLLGIRENGEKLSVIHNAIKAGTDVYMYTGDNIENVNSYVCVDTDKYLLKLGKTGGIASQMVEITYNNLKILRNQSKLMPGMQYRIIDYTTTTIQENTQSAGHQFDIIVTADSKNTLNEEARACIHDGDTYFTEAGANLAAWKIWYCIDNERFAWADESNNGKGVIYRMIDEWNNECPYDFKNIQFRHPYDTDTFPDYYYTFTWIDANSDIMDTSIFGNNGTLTYDSESAGGVYRNVIKSNTTLIYNENSEIYLAKQSLNNIIFIYDYEYGNNGNEGFHGCYNNSFGYGCGKNAFRNDCFDNTFGAGCSNNDFGDSCYRNIFGDRCTGNSFRNDCSYNNFGADCSNNDFDYDCRKNNFGADCSNNDFGDSCSSNTFGAGCTNNTFGGGCYKNTFGNGCYGNAFGVGCYKNTFGNSCYGINFGESKTKLKQFYRYIIFDNGNCKINLNCTSTTSSTNYYQNVRIGLGVNNRTISTTINDSNVGQTYQTVYKPINSIEKEHTVL